MGSASPAPASGEIQPSSKIGISEPVGLTRSQNATALNFHPGAPTRVAQIGQVGYPRSRSAHGSAIRDAGEASAAKASHGCRAGARW